MDKNELRKHYKQKRDAAGCTQSLQPSKTPVSPNFASNAKIFTHLINLPAFINANSVFSYVSFGSEVDTLKIIEYSLAQGKKTAVPKITGKRQMEFFKITGLAELEPNKHGILEPIGSGVLNNPQPASQHGNIILIPGLAFSETMHRIGYGGGFYDVFLPQAPTAIKIGLCYDFQITQFDEDPHDVPLDIIITDKRIISPQSSHSLF